MASLGLAPLTIHGSSSEGQFDIDQMMLLQSGGFIRQDPELNVPTETIDPAVTKPEDDLIKSNYLPSLRP